MITRILLVFLTCALLAACAEETNPNPHGYYTPGETLTNLSRPPKPDRLIAADERAGKFALITNPEDFNDGFISSKYGVWQEVKLHESTGAICGNGSPFKFYINRQPDNNNITLNLEAGGACWDYESCTGQTGIRGARNPHGIPDNYMSNIDIAFMTPFLWRYNPLDRIEPQNWTQIYIPYCTGDIHSGDKVSVYEDPQGINEPIVWHHKGLTNVRTVISWIRENLPRPTRVLTTGCSAGGTGSLVNYYFIRTRLQPDHGYLLNDSGPIFNAYNDGGAWKSRPLHEQIRNVWGLDPLIDAVQNEVAGVDKENLGSIVNVLAETFPQDRLGHTHFSRDLNYSSYSYERFYDEIMSQPTRELKDDKILTFWEEDTANLMEQMDQYQNWAYFIPYYRDFIESHCTTIAEFKASDIQEAGVNIGNFINMLVNDDRELKSYFETDKEADFNKPTNPFYTWLRKIL